jgi:adenylate cyclase
LTKRLVISVSTKGAASAPTYSGVLVSGSQRPEDLVEAERRQITVLFADMVGFTSFSERSGEEATFTLMRALWKLMAEAVREHGGIVQDFTGDGIMAVFGAPIALEDGPLRASRAALSILQRLGDAGPDLEAKHGGKQPRK